MSDPVEPAGVRPTQREETTEGFSAEFAFLSNMYPVECTFQGLMFASSEHLYQWLKVEDQWWRERIRAAPHGKVAKRLAHHPRCPRRQVEDVEAFLIDCMRRALWEKFKTPCLRQQLLLTGDITLVEHNTWNDTFWGVCRGVGHNELGGLLMRLRRYFRENPTNHSVAS